MKILSPTQKINKRKKKAYKRRQKDAINKASMTKEYNWLSINEKINSKGNIVKKVPGMENKTIRYILGACLSVNLSNYLM